MSRDPSDIEPVSTAIGVFGNSVTPLTPEDELDEDRLRSHLRAMAVPGSGVYVCGQGTGEGDLLAEGERIRVYEVAADELGGRTVVGAGGIGVGNPTAVAVRLARAADAAGLDAVQVVGPRPGPRQPRAQEIERYFREIVEAVGCEVHLADNAALTGYRLPTDLLERLLADYPHIRVVNVSDGSSEALHAGVARLVELFGDRIRVRVGICSAIVSTGALGGSGMLGYEPNLAPEVAVGVWEAIVAGDDHALGERLPTLLRLNVLLSRFGNPRSVKAALRILGRDCGPPRPPYLPLPEPDLQELARGLAELELK